MISSWWEKQQHWNISQINKITKSWKSLLRPWKFCAGRAEAGARQPVKADRFFLHLFHFSHFFRRIKNKKPNLVDAVEASLSNHFCLLHLLFWTLSPWLTIPASLFSGSFFSSSLRGQWLAWQAGCGSFYNRLRRCSGSSKTPTAVWNVSLLGRENVVKPLWTAVPTAPSPKAAGMNSGRTSVRVDDAVHNISVATRYRRVSFIKSYLLEAY